MSSFTGEHQTPLLNTSRDEAAQFAIPSYSDVMSQYSAKWAEEKEKFYSQLRENFQILTNEFKSGKQEIFELNESKLGHYCAHYEKAFRELFHDTGYEAHVGTTERPGSGQIKIKKLYITLPECFTL